jgi:putative flippase GtrA
MKQQLIRFGAVGVTALLIHFLIVITITPFGIDPLLANIIAFITAFQLSYLGHSKWTFNTEINHRSLIRFVIVSVSNFCINELLFYLFLKYTRIPYQLALLIVLGVVASLTFLLSRNWAFKSPQNK